MTIARRYLYDTADGVRLEALVGGSWAPLAELVGKLVREERYHQMHASVWLDRLARGGEPARARLVAALATLGPDAATVFAPLPEEAALIETGILAAPMTVLEARWRDQILPVFAALDLPAPPRAADPSRGRLDHSGSFTWLWREFNTVRAAEPGATW
jgi:ring-1,2-phenylacetyl-CoA epoxidase subunit PaaC